MKRCPECRRDYYDDSLLYCLDDGRSLLEGPASSAAVTIVLDGNRPDMEAYAARSAAAQRGPENSIAVLPFKNISADVENEYFCEGLAEELLNALARINGLRVAARTSAFSFKNQTADVGEIGRRLGVAHIVEGSVRKAGDRIRVAVQLVNAADGYHLWSATYDRELRDLFDVQDEITLSVVDALKLKFLGGVKKTVLRRQTENTDAYKAYLQGRYLRYAKNDHSSAALAYEEAIRLDPRHAPSWIGLAESYVLRAHYALIDPLEACAKSKRCLVTAREIQGESAEAYYVEGFAAFIERDWKTCLQAYRRSFEMEPDNARFLGTFGVFSCVLGNVDEGLQALERARDADPLAAYPYAMTGLALLATGQARNSLTYSEQAFAFEQDNTLALWSFSIAAIAVEKYEEGIGAAERLASISKRAGFSVGILGWALARAGRRDEAESVLREMQEIPPAPVVPLQSALLAALDQTDYALELYSNAIDDFAPFAYYVQMPCFDDLRGDPRFTRLVKRLDLPK